MVGLGAGSTISHLVDIIKEQGRDLPMLFLTSSYQTFELLRKSDLIVIPINAVSSTDIYIDGCDQVDKDLNALKSGGGIHTREKILAKMAREFILIGDESKWVEQFDGKYPVVLDVIPEAFKSVSERVRKLYPQSRLELRFGKEKEGPVITENGNYLLEVWFHEWPILSELQATLKSLTGVIETSLFDNLAHRAILAGNSGTRVIERPLKK